METNSPLSTLVCLVFLRADDVCLDPAQGFQKYHPLSTQRPDQTATCLRGSRMVYYDVVQSLLWRVHLCAPVTAASLYLVANLPGLLYDAFYHRVYPGDYFPTCSCRGRNRIPGSRC